jgi:hypothetical protein
MSIIFASNDESDFPRAVVSTTAGNFRSSYVSRAFEVAQGKDFPEFTSWTPFPQAAGDVVWIHFQMRMDYDSVTSNSDGDGPFRIYDTNGALIFKNDMLNGVFSGNVFGSTTGSASITGNWSGTTIRAVDIKIDITAPNLTVEIFDDGISVFNQTVTNNGKLKPAAIYWEFWDITSTAAFDFLYISEFIAADESTIGMGLSEMIPNAAGNYSAWNGNHIETGSSDDGQGASSDATSEKLSSALSTFAGPASSALRALVVNNRASVRGGTVGDLRNFLRISATDYNGAAMGVGAGLGTNVTVWDTNPNSALDWNTTDFSGVEIGVESLV